MLVIRSHGGGGGRKEPPPQKESPSDKLERIYKSSPDKPKKGK